MVERHRRWVQDEGWRGRPGAPDSCPWCRRAIWFWRRRARLVRTIDPAVAIPGRYVWVHESCGQHMKTDGLAK